MSDFYEQQQVWFDDQGFQSGAQMSRDWGLVFSPQTGPKVDLPMDDAGPIAEIQFCELEREKKMSLTLAKMNK